MTALPAARERAGVPSALYRAATLGTAITAAVLALGWALLRVHGGSGDASARDGVLMAAFSLATVGSWSASGRGSPRIRRAWKAIAAAEVLWLAGWYLVVRGPRGEEWQQAASALVSAGSLAAIGGAVLLAQPAGSRLRLRLLTGALATTLSVAALLWNPFLASTVRGWNGTSLDELLTGAHLAAGMAGIFAIFLALQDREQRAAEVSLLLLAAGLTAVVAGNLILAGSDPTPFILEPETLELSLVGALAFISLAAARHMDGRLDYSSTPDRHHPGSLIRQIIPLATSLGALGLAALRPQDLAGGHLPVLLFAGVTTAFAHEVLLLGDQMSLTNWLRSSEAALQQRHQLIVNSSPDLIAVIDLEGRFEFANRAHAWLLGHDPERLLGMPILQLVDRRDAGAMVAVLNPAGRKPHERGPRPVRFKTVDGRSRPFEVAFHPLQGEDGKPRSIVMVSRDIADRRAAERRWRSSEARKGALFASAPDGILSVDRNGFIGETNGAAEMLFGHPADALAGMHLDELLNSVGQTGESPFAQLSGDLIWGQGSVHNVACIGRRGDGREFPAELSVSRVEGVGAEGFIVFVRDISERVRVERQLRDSQKLEAIGRLAGGVAHDFNNLLTVIQGYAEFAKEAAKDRTHLGADVDEIIKASNRARDLTRQLLAFARRQTAAPRTVDPNELVRGMEKLLGRLVTEDITIETRLQEEVGPVHIDPGQLEQVLVNLVVNARDAMPRGGVITIMTEDVAGPDAARLVPGLPSRDYVVISVADTGVGMSPETIDQIFEPFFSTKGPGAGAGLGLATCYGIAKQNDGEITVESELGKGSVFRFWLARASEPATDVPHEVPREIQGGYETILFVEDERGIRTLTERYLRSLGYRVIVAEDGPTALQVVETATDPIHLLISDVVMPRMNGLDLADRVLARSPATHILFISGYPQDVLAERGVLPREVSLLAKPFTFETLALRVREVLDRAGQPAVRRPQRPPPAPVAAEIERRLKTRRPPSKAS